jgi:hypothetical protein
MRWHCGLVALGSVLSCGLANAQPFELERTLSVEFLERLAPPALDGSNVVVIHAEVGSAMIINRRVAADSVVYIRGETFLWAQIAEQLPARSGRGAPIHLDVRRWILDTASCPSLENKVAALLRQLDQTVSDISGANAVKQEFVVDAPTFLIRMGAKDASITITPNGALDPPLQQAALELHSVVSRCAGSKVPVVEQHDF